MRCERLIEQQVCNRLARFNPIDQVFDLDLDREDAIVILYDLPAGEPWMPAGFTDRLILD